MAVVVHEFAPCPDGERRTRWSRSGAQVSVLDPGYRLHSSSKVLIGSHQTEKGSATGMCDGLAPCWPHVALRIAAACQVFDDCVVGIAQVERTFGVVFVSKHPTRLKNHNLVWCFVKADICSGKGGLGKPSCPARCIIADKTQHAQLHPIHITNTVRNDDWVR